ncbi:disease resistance protein RPV1-like [Rhodamnia argentea]|uniref:Disease resistance protein RPV1-like n=1 Tax=Rhodamnia argentea TaxID=178133 RepID=A0ABM3HJ54_9MYRT|nr:disease resistance protein RPV1-like [Rhodamnia argentea]
MDWLEPNQSMIRVLLLVASKLKVLDLSNCEYLMRTPDLSTLVSLERLILEDCRNLIAIDPSIGKLKLLTTLNLKGCNSLQELPEEIGCLQALTEIVMPNMLHELPRTFGNLQSLLTFDVSYRLISKLPYSIGGLVKLRRLNLSGCMKIEELPYSFGELQSLVELDLSSTSLGYLPDSIGNLKQLKILRMTHISRITKLPSVIGLMEKLEELDASRCYNLTGKITNEIWKLSCLRILDLSYTLLSSLPTTLSYLSNLQRLKLESCPELQQLPRLPSTLTCLKWTADTDKFYEGMRFAQASALPSIEGPPLKLPRVELSNTMHDRRLLRSSFDFDFFAGQNLPSSFDFDFVPGQNLPSSLRELELGNVTIESRNFSNLKNLSTLRLASCVMSGYISWTDELMRGPELLPNVLDLSPMTNLQEVHLLGIWDLVELGGLEELGSLCFLSIVDCNSMERMSDLSKLRKLRKLRVGKCPKLRSVEGLNHLESLQKLWIHDCRWLESLAATSDLHLECSTIERCERLRNRNSYCRCHDNRDSVETELDHAGYF